MNSQSLIENIKNNISKKCIEDAITNIISKNNCKIIECLLQDISKTNDTSITLTTDRALNITSDNIYLNINICLSYNTNSDDLICNNNDDIHKVRCDIKLINPSLYDTNYFCIMPIEYYIQERSRKSIDWNTDSIISKPEYFIIDKKFYYI